MNDHLQAKLIEWAEKLGDIATEQLPDFAMQIVAFKAWNATIGLWFSGVLAVIFFVIMITSFIIECLRPGVICKDRYGICEGNTSPKIKMFLCSFVLFIFLIISAFNDYVLIKKCEVAPKLVVIDYIRKS